MREGFRWLTVAVTVAVLALGACANQVRDPAFEDRVALFSTYAASLPRCGAGQPQTVDQLLAGSLEPGARTIIAGHPTPVCTDEPAWEELVDLQSKARRVPRGCPRQAAFWVLWGSRMPRPSRATPEQPACVHVDPEKLTNGIVLAPRPEDLSLCDFEAAERAMPELRVAVTGKLAVLSQDRPAPGVELYVERICRL